MTFENFGSVTLKFFPALIRPFPAKFRAPYAERVPIDLLIALSEILEFYTDSSTRDMGTFIDIEMRQYMLLMYNSVKQRKV